MLWRVYHQQALWASEHYAEAIASSVELHRFDYYRAMRLPLPATLVQEQTQNESLNAARQRKQTSDTDSVVDLSYEHHDAESQSIAQLRGTVERAVFDSMDAARSEPVLANWSGQVGARIETLEGRPVDRIESELDYHLVVAFGRNVGKDFETRSIDVRGGRDVDPVAFELLLDGDAVRFPPMGEELLVPVDGRKTTATYTFTAPKQGGEVRIWVQVLQLNRLLQVVTLTADVDSAANPGA